MAKFLKDEVYKGVRILTKKKGKFGYEYLLLYPASAGDDGVEIQGESAIFKDKEQMLEAAKRDIIEWWNTPEFDQDRDRILNFLGVTLKDVEIIQRDEE